MQARTLRGAQREAVASERNDFAPAGPFPAGAISCLRRTGSAHPAPELGADDARGHGHVERLGARAVGGERRDVEAPRNAGGGGGTHAAAFVAHDDDACGREVGAVEVLAVEKGAVDGDAGGGQGVDVPVDGAGRDAKILRQLFRCDILMPQQEKNDLDQSVYLHNGPP